MENAFFFEKSMIFFFRLAQNFSILDQLRAKSDGAIFDQ